MMKWTIGKKITIFYAAVLLIFTAAFFTIIYFFAVNQIRESAGTLLAEAIDDGFENIVYDEGLIQITDEFQTNYRGVALIVYDQSGVRVMGSEPSGFPIYTPLESGRFHLIETNADTWMIYDTLMVYDNGVGIWIRGIYDLDIEVSSLGALSITMMMAVPGLVIVALIAGGLIARKSMKPVTDITEAVSRINDGHDLSVRLPMGRNRDELYRLAETLNAMIDRLETAFKSEEEFTSDVSHELKTPVSVILAECEYALMAADSEEEYRDSLAAIQAQCVRMNSLIIQLLQMSRTINTDKIIEKHRINLSALCESVTAELKGIASDKGVALTCIVQPAIYVEGDETLLVRMLINLVTNGIKYRDTSKEEPFVSLSLIRDGEGIAIEISDNGIGISEADLLHVFDRFYKADKSRSHAGEEAGSGSFGLGLSMVKWIAEAHEGTVSAESRPEEGSVFTVRLVEAVEHRE